MKKLSILFYALALSIIVHAIYYPLWLDAAHPKIILNCQFEGYYVPGEHDLDGVHGDIRIVSIDRQCVTISQNKEDWK